MSINSHSQENREGIRRSPTGVRGRKRKQLILDTAAELLAEGGVEGVTTNALASRAGIAVGSVYQYFSNKEAILLALGERYLEQLGQNTVSALQQELSDIPIRDMVDRVIDPMVAFERRHPAFGLLNASPEGGAAIAEGARRVDNEVLITIRDLCLRIRPHLDPDLAWRIARVTKAIYKGISYLLQQEREIAERGGDIDRLLSDMKGVMAGYLEAHLGSTTID